MKTDLFTILRNLMVVLMMAGTVACSNKSALTEANEMPPAPTDEEAAAVEPVESGVLLANVIFDSIDYVLEHKQLMASFIKEFGDGTVVDKVMIKKIDDDKKHKPIFYLVGLGQNNGSFRSMALELEVASDNSLYLKSNGIKHTARAVNCPFCFFNFEENEIMGVSCADTDGEFECVYTTTEANTYFSRNTKTAKK